MAGLTAYGYMMGNRLECSRQWLTPVALGLLLVSVSGAAGAQSAAVNDSARVARAERALLAAEDSARYANLNRLRATYLAKAGWADLGDRCNPGNLRIFPSDTTPAQRDSIQALVEQMEFAVVSGGVGTKLDTPDSRRLLRVVVGWESGIDRPNWDADGRAPLRPAVATGLTGEVPDPQGPGCLASPISTDTVTFVIPGFTTMDFPQSPKTRVKAFFGPDGQKHARNEFHTTVGRNAPQEDLAYVLVAPMVIWRDYALVAVRRPVEQGGVALDGASRGGAVYLFRRAGAGASTGAASAAGANSEWRLLSIVRTWGG